ncbi:Cytochrome c biogenesis protein CcsB [Xylophilus ampelinus]|nr:cytochrome c biogenesis protein ResB [Variovorax sp.]VTY32802.1 Cytochrome c biogenesis protein CcsB [Xylophilus ampelinus]
MSVSTHGLRLKTGSQALRAGVELLSSMRFAIALLTVICIASIIGTVLKQHEPIGNYINQFGPFWAQVFRAARLDSIYSAWWFLLILAFLVVSTSLCIARNTPRILADLKTFKEDIRAQSLKAFGLRAEAALAESPEQAANRIGQLLVSGGWKVKLQRRDGDGSAGGWMVAARAGGANKLGYIAAHGAIVLVCLGGLLDGDLIVRAQTWFNGKSVYTGGGLISEVPAQYRLSPANPTFRGNILVPEGSQSSVAILNQADGVLLQELPFAIELKKFIVDYYSTGMPKLFASEVVLHDRATGERKEARIEVNHPASWKGIEIYQSSFDDGGSSVKLQAVPMAAAAKPFEIEGTIGGSSELTNGNERLKLEYTALRVINVENFADQASGSGADVRKVDLQHSLESRLGAANKVNKPKVLRNIGPSIGYKLRDASGQAREYQNYMVPAMMTEDGPPVFLLGMRDQPDQPFRYLRVPADEQGSMDGYLHLRSALADAAMRQKAVDRYVAHAIDPGKTEQVEQLRNSAARALALFAGAERVRPTADGKADDASAGGWQAIAEFIDLQVPEAERQRAGQVLVRIVNDVLFELLNLSREQAGQAALPMDDKTQAWLTQAVLAISDAHFYPAPVALMLTDFKQVQASVFQVARAPGKKVVYLGCLLLIVGIFAMLYVRERRLWVWIAPAGDVDAGSRATMALSANRRNLDSDKEFAHLRTKLLMLPAPAGPGDTPR